MIAAHHGVAHQVEPVALARPLGVKRRWSRTRKDGALVDLVAVGAGRGVVSGIPALEIVVGARWHGQLARRARLRAWVVRVGAAVGCLDGIHRKSWLVDVICSNTAVKGNGLRCGLYVEVEILLCARAVCSVGDDEPEPGLLRFGPAVVCRICCRDDRVVKTHYVVVAFYNGISAGEGVALVCYAIGLVLQDSAVGGGVLRSGAAAFWLRGSKLSAYAQRLVKGNTAVERILVSPALLLVLLCSNLCARSRTGKGGR